MLDKYAQDADICEKLSNMYHNFDDVKHTKNNHPKKNDWF